MMSKKSSKRKTAPNKEIDWVEPSFIDFCETAKLSSSVLHKKSLTDNYHENKEHFPLLENYKCGRKIRKPISVDEKYKQFKQNHSQTEPWVDKYKPKTQLAITGWKVVLCCWQKKEEQSAWRPKQK